MFEFKKKFQEKAGLSSKPKHSSIFDNTNVCDGNVRRTNLKSVIEKL